MWESTPMEVRDTFTYLDSLCFNAYMNAPTTKMSSWTKASDILGHWNLLILCNFGASFDSNIEIPCMLLLDSLLSIGARSLQVHIISFVMDIYNAVGREVDKDIIAQIPLHVPKVSFIHNLFITIASLTKCHNKNMVRNVASSSYILSICSCGMHQKVNVLKDIQILYLTGAWFNREEVDKFDEEVRLFLARNKDNVTSEVDFPDMKEEEIEEE
ncbi:hypothetical protein Taro_052252, partial [Colocasia esculenta]|nr:hypothetical protein [Colocasia esculenta]